MPPENAFRNFAERYTAAWCSQNAASVASFFAVDGWLKVNDGEPAMGRAAITGLAQGFMDTFPDLVVRMDEFAPSGETAAYFWTLTGTAARGQSVCVSGVERWTMGSDGLIAQSVGQFDSAEYQRQMAG